MRIAQFLAVGALYVGSVSASIHTVPKLSFPALDIRELHDKDAFNEKLGAAPRFAVERHVNVSPLNKGQWVQEGSVWKWRLKVYAAQAVSLNFAFTEFKMSENSRLSIYSTDYSEKIRDFTAKDNNIHNELWTPVIMAEEVIVELSAPQDEIDQTRLVLGQVNQGYRTFAQTTEKSGSCNVDVVCSEGDEWRSQINSVAVISTGGSTFCTGFMVNNTSNDKTPFFMTAKHCRIHENNAASLVAYWDYQASSCGGDRDGGYERFNTGAEFLAASYKSDFTLVKLLQSPEEDWNVAYAGFDATDVDSPSATAIHHPNTDEKSISFEFDPVTVTSYIKSEVPGDGTHIRVEDWDVGTTEPGSSGSPLFNADKRVIGQLHGGYASCSSQTADWYGRLHTSWEGDGTPETRLKDWLDPGKTGEMVTDTIQ